jgi:hypothetical protein
MNKNERLPHPEIFPETPESNAYTEEPKESRVTVETLYERRFFNLETIKNDISLSFYYMVHEKITSEKEKLFEILHLEDKKEKYLQKYSFILDSAYFDQQFITPHY